MLDLDKVKNFTEDKRRSRFLCLLYTHLLVLFLMTIGRILFHILFKEHTPAINETLMSYAYGFVFDLRATTIVLMPTTLLVFIPMTFTAQDLISKVVTTLQVIFLFAYQVIAALDMGHYHLIKLRINSSLIDLILGQDVWFQTLWQDYPVFLIFVGLTILTVCLTFIIEMLKKRYLYKGQYGLIFFPYRWERFFWLLLITPLLYGKYSTTPLQGMNLAVSEIEFINQLALNPLMNGVEEFIILNR